LGEFKVIEFKATYHYRTKADSIEVLVQYDGVILHVWHLSEPFHRLVSSDEFQIAKPILPANRHTIKLSNGGRIRTDDRQAFDRLSQRLKNAGGRGVCAMAQNWVLALIGSMSIAVGLWWLVSNGLLF
jgi:hypothetical protein